YEVDLEPASEPEAVSSTPATPVGYEPKAVSAPPTRYVGYKPQAPAYGPSQVTKAGLEPVNSTYVIEPGDTFYEVSLKMYSTSDAAKAIAVFNRIPLNVKLRPGTVVYLPSISADGNMSASQAPPAGAR